MNELTNKTLIMIVGPTAIGKSTLMREVIRIDPRFSYVQSFTTRPARPGERSSYRHISEAEAATLHSQGKTLTWIVHPTTQVIYGTTADSFQTEYNLLDTLSNTVQLYRDLPFHRIVTISLTADASDWRRWLAMRFPEINDDLQKRLREAKASIEWSLAQDTDHHWLVNNEEHLGDVARQVIAIASGELESTATPPEAGILLETVNNLLSYK